MKSSGFLKKTCLALVLGGALSVSVYAFDFGVSLDNNTSLYWSDAEQAQNVNPVQANQLSTWYNFQINDLNLITFGGYYRFLYNNGGGTWNGTNLSNTGDLTSLYWSTSIPQILGDNSRLNLTVGRQVFTDATGELLDATMDGATLDLANPSFNFKFSVGTPTLLFHWDNNIVMSKADLLRASDTANLLSPERLIIMTELGLPNTNDALAMGFELITQFDLRNNLAKEGDTQSLTSPGPGLSTLYLGLNMDGLLGNVIQWHVLGAVDLGYTESGNYGQFFTGTTLIGFLLGFDANLVFDVPQAPRFAVGVRFASGDADANTAYSDSNTLGQYNAFIPISVRSDGLLFNPQLNNALIVNAQASIKPFSSGSYSPMQNFELLLKGGAFMRTDAKGQIAESGLNTSNTTDIYLGTAADFSINWRPTPDIGVSLGYGVFFPNQSVLNRKIEMALRLAFSLGF